MTGALSPVSPIELASPQVWHSNATPTTIQDGKTNMTPDQSLDDSSQQSSNASSVRRKPEWIPFTFRWYFLLIPTLLSVSFGIIIVLLVRSSGHNHGLGGDDGSSAILFGWRFTPTLLAVLYTQLTVILFEDAKRTEPHARLTKAPVTGASAYGTVLQTPRAWWAILMDVVVRRNVIGRTSWCLACAALVNVFAVLFISPLSSALLTSEEVSIPTPMEFFRMTTKDKVRLPIDDSRETYLRTMAALLRNVSTSAWITDSAITLPIWPLTEQGQFGSSVQSAFSSWTAESTTISAGMDCQNMTLESANLSPKPYVGWDVLDHGPYRGTEPMVTFALSSNVGCHYELTMHPATDLAYNGGIRWSNASTFYLVEDGRELLQLGRIPFARNVSSTSPYAQITASKQCDDKELILMSTPWTKTIKTNLTDGSRLGYNRTYERSTDFRMKALLCTTHVTLSRHETTVIMNSNGMPYISISDKKIMQPEAGSADVVDMDAFQQMSLQDEWKNYLYIGNDADEKTGGFETPGIDRAVRPAIPGFAGMAPLLGAMYGFDLNAAMNDFDISERIKRVKGRFLNECLHGTLAGVTILGQEKVMGKVKVVQQRVVVLREIGITIAALFFGSTILLLSVFLTSRLAFRPLNLHTDPGSTVGLSLLLQGQSRRSLVFRAQHGSTTAEFHRGVRSETFYSINGSLFSGGRGASCTVSQTPKLARKPWQPFVIRLRTLLALCCLLAMVLVGLLVLYSFSIRSRLSQLAFIYEADISKLGLSFPTFAPISIAPTLLSIAIGLWWDQLDITFRILQPYIAMSRRPTPIYQGAGLTYKSKTWAGAAFKAARNKHWMLFIIAIGSVWCQILTVSMSALFERQFGISTRQNVFMNTLGIRQNPVITQINAVTNRVTLDQDSRQYPFYVLENLLADARQNWMTSAAIQVSLNGTVLPWTHGGWSFIPVDLTAVTKPGAQGVKSASTNINITLQTAALRARLQCNAVPEVANLSSWLSRATPNATWRSTMDFNSTKDWYTLDDTIFEGSSSNTTTFVNENSIACCGNGTRDEPQPAAIGFWSPVDQDNFPFNDTQWPVPFVTKWIVGRALNLTVLKPWNTARKSQKLIVFEELPSLQAARCVPLIETANMTIIVDAESGFVYSHQMVGSVLPMESAWSDAFIRHQLTNSSQYFNGSYMGALNMTTSFGVLFMDSMFRATDTTYDYVIAADKQSLTDNTFIMRDSKHGLNMDLMTYTMYNLANKDPQALLDYTRLAANADYTLQTFFQHFVRNQLSLAQGGLTFQSMNDRGFESLGSRIDENGKPLPEKSWPELNVERNITGTISEKIQILHMNEIATYLTVAILIWLIGTTALVTCLQRRYTALLLRDVQLIADVLVLVAGSDNFLELVARQGVTLKNSKDVKTMLGWFKDRQGEVRWGVEVVGGPNAVEWVDAPKQGFHIPVRSTRRMWLPWRRS